MARKTYTRYFSFTKKEEEWETIEFKTRPYGKEGKISTIPQQNCMNTTCKVRGTNFCPFGK